MIRVFGEDPGFLFLPGPQGIPSLHFSIVFTHLQTLSSV